MTFGADPRTIPSGRQVVDTFRKNGYEPEGYTLYAYASVQSIVAAMKSTNSSDGEKLAKWLHSHEITTVMGPKVWDAKGDLTISDYVMYRWNDKGKYQTVQ